MLCSFKCILRFLRKKKKKRKLQPYRVRSYVGDCWLMREMKCVTLSWGARGRAAGEALVIMKTI